MRFEALFGTIARFRFQGFPVVASGPLRAGRGLGRLVLALVLAIGVAGGAVAFDATGPRPTVPAASVHLSDLPGPARSTQQLIRHGGPFPYAKDGSVFANRERLLPPKARGYYREYTVPTPGLRHRGARRIVCGGLPPDNPEACYYSDDHYASFHLIVQ